MGQEGELERQPLWFHMFSFPKYKSYYQEVLSFISDFSGVYENCPDFI